jgi:hypothetical protein
MRAIVRRLLVLEQRHVAQRNAQGLTPSEVFRQRICRRQAAETGTPYEDVLREHEEKSRQYWKNYDGDGSAVDILRYHFRRAAVDARAQAATSKL